MKIKIIIALVISFCQVSFSQTKEWKTYDFDSIVSIDMPYEIFKLDTIDNNQKKYQISSSNGSSNFIVQKLSLGKLYSNNEVVELPHDENSLEEYYLEIMKVFREGVQFAQGFKKELNYSLPESKLNLKGYKVVFEDRIGLPIYEMRVFIVNKYIYSFTYRDTNSLTKIERKNFFDSITFNSKAELKQFNEKSSFFNKKIILILLSLLLLLSFIIRFKSKRKSN